MVDLAAGQIRVYVVEDSCCLTMMLATEDESSKWVVDA